MPVRGEADDRLPIPGGQLLGLPGELRNTIYDHVIAEWIPSEEDFAGLDLMIRHIQELTGARDSCKQASKAVSCPRRDTKHG